MKLPDAKLRSSCPEVFYKKGALRNFKKFAGKHLCQRLFFNKVADLAWPATLLKKSLWHMCFPVNFAKFLTAPFLQNTSGGCFCKHIRHAFCLRFLRIHHDYFFRLYFLKEIVEHNFFQEI